jgi:DNA-binding transcriptional ArsR family regulator
MAMSAAAVDRTLAALAEPNRRRAVELLAGT